MSVDNRSTTNFNYSDNVPSVILWIVHLVLLLVNAWSVIVATLEASKAEQFSVVC